jgi:preprotein translocase subunit SecE
VKGGILVADNKKGDSKNIAAKKENRKLFSGIKKSVLDLKSEIKKIVWPTKKTIINNTMIVIGVVVLCSLVVGGLDAVLMALVNLVLRSA